MRLLVSFGQPLHGRAAIVDALEKGREAAIYRARVHRFEWLDEHTLLTFAFARYALEGGGFAEGNVYWLDELHEGLICARDGVPERGGGPAGVRGSLRGARALSARAPRAGMPAARGEVHGVACR